MNQINQRAIIFSFQDYGNLAGNRVMAGVPFDNNGFIFLKGNVFTG